MKDDEVKDFDFYKPEQFRIRDGRLSRLPGHDYAGKVRIPDGVEIIVDGAFEDRKLEELIIPDSVTHIGADAFKDCTALKRIVFGSGVVNIGSGAFENDAALERAELPRGLVNIGDDAFNGCSALAEINLPSGLTKLGDYAFMNCTAIKRVDVPDGVTELGAVFCGCTALTHARIGKGVAKLYDGAFARCSALERIDVDPENTEYKSVDGIVYNKAGTYIFIVPRGICGDVELAHGLSNIGAGELNGCAEMTGVTIPNGVEYIGKDAFANCTALERVTIPDGVTCIAESAFCGCSRLKHIFLPKSVAQAGDKAFGACPELEIYLEGDVGADFIDKTVEHTVSTYTPEDDAFNFHRSSGGFTSHDTVETLTLCWNPNARPVHTFVSREEYEKIIKN